MAITTVSIGSNQNISTVTPSSCAESGPWDVTFTSTPSSDVAVGDMYVSYDNNNFGNYFFLLTAISGSTYTLKYITDDSMMGSESPCNLVNEEYEQASGTFKRWFATVTLFNDSLCSQPCSYGGNLYDGSNDIVGEMHADSDFTDTGTYPANAQPTDVTLTAYEADRHLGVIGNGVVWKPTANEEVIEITYVSIEDTPSKWTLSWIEFDFSSFTGNIGVDVGEDDYEGADVYITNNIFHSMSNHANNLNPIRFSGRGYIMNNMVYNITDDGDWAFAINLSQGSDAVGCYNNTVYKITNTGADGANGIRTGDTDHLVKNNLVMTVTGAPAACYLSDGGVSGSSDYNVGSDTSANSAFGSNSVNSAVLADTFEEYSTATATDFLRLKTGSAAIGVSEDLVTTPVGVNIDLNGFDRNSVAVDWDAGCFQFTTSLPPVASSTTNAAFLLFLEM